MQKFTAEIIAPADMPKWKEKGYMYVDDHIECDDCKIDYSREHYQILYDRKKIAYFWFPEPEKMSLNLYCHTCLFKNIKKLVNKEEEKVQLIILDQSHEYKCNFYPQDKEPEEWDDDESDGLEFD